MQQYVINPQVIHETIHGETIIIDLQTGTYYSLQGAGPVIWNAIVAGMNDQQIAAHAEAQYVVEADQVERSIADFLQELTGAQLIAPGGQATATTPITAPQGDRAAFEPPRLEQYTDMQDIILLDPVHKVDSQGWPHAASAAHDPA